MIKSFPLLVTAFSLNAAEFPAPYNSEPDKTGPMPAVEAAANLKLPPGFQATIFAAEPDVQNPIALSWDGRGRLWIAENYTYAERTQKFDLNLRDRILIFEDKDGDSRFDARKVFTDEVQMLASIQIGFGGVWLICPPQLLFIPDRNGDDIPDGPAEVLLDGFKVPPENYHTFANGLRFGPDGWLYGRCGASSTGEIGAPGTPPAQRIPLRGTIWRYHPQRRVFEALSSGTTNPWGHDWDAHGELFFINTVNGHLWHGIPGAHFMRPHTIDPNPRAYALIDQHADHWHFDTAVGWSQSRDGKAAAYGGGHAHVGMMIYLADDWPAEYRGRLFTLNLHGRRANQEILERRGSGYVGRHGPDFFLAADPWFRGMELSYGPDGGVFVLDWSDTGECHESTGVHRTSGRIYKITYGPPKRATVSDLAQLSATELVKLHTHSNEWFVRQARIELAARAQSGKTIATATDELRQLYQNQTNVVTRLRALWSLYTLGAADETFLRAQLDQPDEHIRAWAVRLLTDTGPLDTVMSQRPDDRLVDAGLRGVRPSSAAAAFAQSSAPDNPRTPASASVAAPEDGRTPLNGRTSGERSERRPAGRFTSSEPPTETVGTISAATLSELNRLAKSDPSALVRLTLASTLQRLPVSQRVALAAPLVAHQEDANDHNLPLLIWYGLIPVAESDPSSLAILAAQCELPTTRQLIARRLAEDVEKNPAPLNRLLELAITKPESFQADILDGLAEALTGWRQAKKPAAWDALAKKLNAAAAPRVRHRVRDLSVVFGDGRALDDVKKVALDKDADLSARKAALQTLIDNRPPDLRRICEQLLDVSFLNPVAARGLATFDDPAIGAKLARAYRQFHPSERAQLLAALVSRPSFARALLDAVAEGKIPRTDISAFDARQMRGFNDASLNQKLTQAWGEFRDTSTDKRESIAKWKARLTPAVLALANTSQGRVVFNNVCASCHTLYGEGGKVGPDLTGSGRDNLDYLLESLADPSAIVPADFKMSVVELKDGRVLNALVAAKTERTLTLKTATETLTLERNQIESIHESTLSLMPEGLLEALTPEQACDLIAYLMHRTQVPLPVRAATGRP